MAEENKVETKKVETKMEKKMEDKKTTGIAKKVENKEDKTIDKVTESKKETKTNADEQTNKVENQTEIKSDYKEQTSEKKTEGAKEKKEPIKVKKEEAIANGVSLRASKKHCMYICKFIVGKKIDDALKLIDDVVNLRKAVPMIGEIPHRGGGMMSGRYPQRAAKQFIPLLKGLKGNAAVNGMDLEKTVIVEGISNWAARPSRSRGRNGKRTHVLLKAREISNSGVKK